MHRALGVGLTRLMQWKGEEHEAVYAIEGRLRSGRGSHAAAKRVAAGQDRQVDSRLMGRGDRRTDGCCADLLRIPSFTVLHVWEIVSERRDTGVGHPLGDI